MTDKSKAWKVASGARPERLISSEPDLERHLEEWISDDIDIVAPDLMLLGRQVETESGAIDLLALHRDGDLVIIELKKGRTPRSIIAQAIDYAEWASRLTHDNVVNRFGGEEELRRQFLESFQDELPSTLNEGQRILLVATSVSQRVAAMVDYLSREFFVPINVISFDFYTVNGEAILVRDVLVDEALEPASTARRARKRTVDDLREVANEIGHLDVVDELLTLTNDVLPRHETYQTSIALQGRMTSGKWRVPLSIYPASIGEEHVIVRLDERGFADLLDLSDAEALELIGQLQRCGEKPLRPFKGGTQVAVPSVEVAEQLVKRIRDAFSSDE